jgi:hypothetical protein
MSSMILFDKNRFSNSRNILTGLNEFLPGFKYFLIDLDSGIYIHTVPLNNNTIEQM